METNKEKWRWQATYFMSPVVVQKFLVLFASLFLLAWPAAAGDQSTEVKSTHELLNEGWKLPRPPYPYVANQRGEQGTGTVELTTDAKGDVTAASMVKKIGYPTLDDFVVKWALEEWKGPPNTKVVTTITFEADRIVDSSGSDPKTLAAEGWHTEKPPYPFEARAHHEQGHMDVEIITGSDGRVIQASVPKSKDHPTLDLFTAKWAQEKWSGPPRHKLKVPVTYQLR